jgi:hypothetical protein
MSTTVEQLAEQAMDLSVESRARLADLLSFLESPSCTSAASPAIGRNELRKVVEGRVMDPKILPPFSARNRGAHVQIDSDPLIVRST